MEHAIERAPGIHGAGDAVGAPASLSSIPRERTRLACGCVPTRRRLSPRAVPGIGANPKGHLRLRTSTAGTRCASYGSRSCWWTTRGRPRASCRRHSPGYTDIGRGPARRECGVGLPAYRGGQWFAVGAAAAAQRADVHAAAHRGRSFGPPGHARSLRTSYTVLQTHRRCAPRPIIRASRGTRIHGQWARTVRWSGWATWCCWRTQTAVADERLGTPSRR